MSVISRMRSVTRGGRRERDQRLVVAVDDAVDRAERGEPGRLGADRPLDDPRAIDAAHGVRKPDPDVHGRRTLAPRYACAAMATARRPALSSRLAGFGTTIFAEMSALAARTGSINLGQGFPDTDGPPEVVEAAVAALRAGHNQYPPGAGIPALRAAVADAPAALLRARARPRRRGAGHRRRDRGDRRRAARPVRARRRGDRARALLRLLRRVRRDGRRDAAAGHPAPARTSGSTPPSCAAAVTPRTRLILLNTPHNPTGTVLSRDELEAVAALCREHDLLAVTDEVYEHLVFDGEHVPLATLPGMARAHADDLLGRQDVLASPAGRSAGRAGRAELVAAVRTAKQFLTYRSATPLQHAVAAALALPDDYFAGLADGLQRQARPPVRRARGRGPRGLPPGRHLLRQHRRPPLGEHDGVAFCRELPERAGVVAIPTAVFYDDPARGRSLVRFAFCKRDEVIDEAARRPAPACAPPVTHQGTGSSGRRPASPSQPARRAAGRPERPGSLASSSLGRRLGYRRPAHEAPPRPPGSDPRSAPAPPRSRQTGGQEPAGAADHRGVRAAPDERAGVRRAVAHHGPRRAAGGRRVRAAARGRRRPARHAHERASAGAASITVRIPRGSRARARDRADGRRPGGPRRPQLSRLPPLAAAGARRPRAPAARTSSRGGARAGLTSRGSGTSGVRATLSAASRKRAGDRERGARAAAARGAPRRGRAARARRRRPRRAARRRRPRRRAARARSTRSGSRAPERAAHRARQVGDDALEQRVERRGGAPGGGPRSSGALAGRARARSARPRSPRTCSARQPGLQRAAQTSCTAPTSGSP